MTTSVPRTVKTASRNKLDFGGDALPCSDFNANALYFLITALSYNVFALMRQLLPGELARHRAITIRWRLYAIAAKVVKTGRQLEAQGKTPEVTGTGATGPEGVRRLFDEVGNLTAFTPVRPKYAERRFRRVKQGSGPALFHTCCDGRQQDLKAGLRGP